MPPNNQFTFPAQPQPGQPAPAPTPRPNQAPPVVGSKSSPKNTNSGGPIKNPNSTQAMLKFSEIRDNLMVMNDGSFRAIVRCQSINFDLMSTAEKEGIELSYQNFLNSLTFPIQIVIRSKKVDVEPYLQQMVALRQQEDNMLLGVLMEDYINFIDRISQEVNIMTKDFYVVVPYNPAGELSGILKQSKSFFFQLFAPPTQNVTKIDANTYEKAKVEISNRVESVMAGLFQIGIRCGQMNTKDLGEMMYNFYNPDTAIQQPLADYSQVTGGLYVQKGQGLAPNLQEGANG